MDWCSVWAFPCSISVWEGRKCASELKDFVHIVQLHSLKNNHLDLAASLCLPNTPWEQHNSSFPREERRDDFGMSTFFRPTEPQNISMGNSGYYFRCCCLLIWNSASYFLCILYRQELRQDKRCRRVSHPTGHRSHDRIVGAVKTTFSASQETVPMWSRSFQSYLKPC